MKLTAILPLVLIQGLLSGCNMLTNYKELEANKRLAIVTEVKQDIGSGKYREFKVTCPEASPDALMMLAGSLSGETKSGVAIASAFSESGSNIGLRTHSIQLLRDQLFSICQAYANQGLTAYTYQTLLSRNQQNTITLMAIEQLTGVLKSPLVAITTNTDSAATQLLKLKSDLETANSKLSALKDKTSEEAVALKKTIDDTEKKIATTQNLAASAAGTIEVKLPESKSQGLGSDNVKAITDAVVLLVQMTNANTAEPNKFMVCTDILQSSAYLSKVNLETGQRTAQYTPLESACKDFVTQTIASNAEIAKAINTETNTLNKSSNTKTAIDSSIQRINTLQQLIK